MTVGIVVLGLVALQRLGELVLAGRNTRRLKAMGAVEYGAGHYPLIVLLHAAWLGALWALAWDRPASWPWLSVFLLLQGLRVWVIASLGVRWTTRIIVPASQAPVRRGPYRIMRHPNYAVVAAEIAVLPLAFGLPILALLFSALNGVIILGLRIPAERRAMRNDNAIEP